MFESRIVFWISVAACGGSVCMMLYSMHTLVAVTQNKEGPLVGLASFGSFVLFWLFATVFAAAAVLAKPLK